MILMAWSTVKTCHLNWMYLSSPSMGVMGVPGVDIPSGNITQPLKMMIYSEFSHWTWWFSTSLCLFPRGLYHDPNCQATFFTEPSTRQRLGCPVFPMFAWQNPRMIQLRCSIPVVGNAASHFGTAPTCPSNVPIVRMFTSSRLSYRICTSSRCSYG